MPFHQTLEVPIRGMDCPECTRHVRDAISGLPGVESVDVSLDGTVTVRTAALAWAGEAPEVTAESFKAKRGPHPAALHDAVAFLQQALTDGPRSKAVVLKEAHEAGIAARTLYRAGEHLRIVSQSGEDGDTFWRLPSLSH